jgi:hypothetical protein
LSIILQESKQPTSFHPTQAIPSFDGYAFCKVININMNLGR